MREDRFVRLKKEEPVRSSGAEEALFFFWKDVGTQQPNSLAECDRSDDRRQQPDTACIVHRQQKKASRALKSSDAMRGGAWRHGAVLPDRAIGEVRPVIIVIV